MKFPKNNALKLMAAVLLIGMLAAPITAQQAGDRISGTGTVIFNEFEGGFYGIEGDDGGKYRPMNLSEEFQVNGTRVFYELTVAEQQESIFMWGLAVHVDNIGILPGIGDTGTVNGTVWYIPEDDTYGIITDDGLRILPENIPEEFRANGTHITFEYSVTAVHADTLWPVQAELSNVQVAQQSCSSCNSYWWAYSMIFVVLAAFILFKILRSGKEGGGDGQQ